MHLPSPNVARLLLVMAVGAAGCAKPAPDPHSPAAQHTAGDHAAADHAVHEMPAPAAASHADHMASLPATAGDGYAVGDVRFMQHMIGHHAQAIIMAAKAPTHAGSDKVRGLAQKIAISQRDEINMMKRWLTERKQVVPTDSQSLAMMMPGMLTPAQMTQLDAATGTEFDRLFLTFMIAHHRGALTMVEELFKSPGAAQEPDIFRFATDVDADQRDEIYVMQTMLDAIR